MISGGSLLLALGSTVLAALIHRFDAGVALPIGPAPIGKAWHREWAF